MQLDPHESSSAGTFDLSFRVFKVLVERHESREFRMVIAGISDEIIDRAHLLRSCGNGMHHKSADRSLFARLQQALCGPIGSVHLDRIELSHAIHGL
jgi:hypothetical protein